MVSKEVKDEVKNIKCYLNENVAYYIKQKEELELTPQDQRMMLNRQGDLFDVVSWKIGKLKSKINATKKISLQQIESVMNNKFAPPKMDKYRRDAYLSEINKWDHLGSTDWKPSVKIQLSEIRKAIAACREGNPFE